MIILLVYPFWKIGLAATLSTIFGVFFNVNTISVIDLLHPPIALLLSACSILTTGNF